MSGTDEWPVYMYRRSFFNSSWMIATDNKWRVQNSAVFVFFHLIISVMVLSFRSLHWARGFRLRTVMRCPLTAGHNGGRKQCWTLNTLPIHLQQHPQPTSGSILCWVDVRI